MFDLKKITTSFVVLVMILGSLFSNTINYNLVLAQDSEEQVVDSNHVEMEDNNNEEHQSKDEPIIVVEEENVTDGTENNPPIEEHLTNETPITEEVIDVSPSPEVTTTVEDITLESPLPEESSLVDEIIEQTKEPSVDVLYDGDLIISGTGEVNSLIKVVINEEVFETIVLESEKWSIELTNPLITNQEVVVNAKLEGKEVSLDKKIIVLPIEIIEEEIIDESIEKIDLLSPSNPDGVTGDETPLDAIINYNIFPETGFLGLSGMMMAKSSRMIMAAMAHPTQPGQVLTSKTATPVPGMGNTWDITVRIEGKDETKTSDIVLVIDTSGSMNNNNRMTAAKDAAKSFISTLLATGSTTSLYTRIAVISYSSIVSNNVVGLTTNIETLNNKINGLEAYGGTFTQAAIKQAQAMLANSTSDYKNIVLLSDGEPTYSYRINFPNGEPPKFNTDIDYLSKFLYDPNYPNVNPWETTVNIPQDRFTTATAGNGQNLRSRYYYDFYMYIDSNNRFYNHGNSAIAESGFAKNAGTTVYSIALEAGSVGIPILNSIASPGKSYTASPGDLNSIFQNIAGNIGAAVTNATVTDPMGLGFTIPAGSVSGITTVPTNTATYHSATNSITWNPGTLTTPLASDNTIKYAELTYRVEITDEILNATPNGDNYSTNGETILTYTNLNGDVITENFIVPQVDPILLVLEKKLIDTHGNTIENDGRVFNVQVTSNNGYNQSYTLTGGQKRVLTNLRLEDTYTVVENGFSGTPVTLSSDYDTTYNIYGENTTTFNIRQGDPDSPVIVTNIEKPLGKLIINKIFKPLGDVALKALRSTRNTSPDFEFTVTGPNGYSEVFSLKTGESKTIEGLKYGEYTVVETNSQGFESTYNDDFDVATDGKVTLKIDDKQHSVTVTNSPKDTETYTDVNATKIWNGGPVENYYAIVLSLLEDGTPMDPQPTYTVTQGTGNLSNEFYYNWADLQKYDKTGNLINYTIQENDVPLKYEATYSADKLTVTNTYNPDITARTEANKIWKGGPTPKDTVWFKLYRQIPNGSVEEVPVDEAPLKELPNGTTKVEWLNLPSEDHLGNEYTYSVKEVDANGNPLTLEHYSIYEDGLNVTNTYIPPKGNVKATKEWIKGPNVHPTVWFKLYRNILNGQIEEVPNAALFELVSGTLEASWDDIDLKDLSGNDYIFTVKEVDANGNDFTPENYTKEEIDRLVKNTYKSPVLNNIKAIKIWKDGPNPKPLIGLRLHRYLSGSTPSTEPETDMVSGATTVMIGLGNTQAVWANMPKTDENGVDYIYYVKEVHQLGGYTPGTPPVIVYGPPTNYALNEAGNVTDGFEVTNTYVIPKDVSVTANKTWEGGPDPKPVVYLKLFRTLDGITESPVDVDMVEISGTTTQAIWNDLERTDIDGNEYTYIVKEVNAAGEVHTPENYYASQTGYDIKNIYVTPKVKITAQKTWDGGDLLIKPVTLQLQRSTDGTAYSNVGSTVTLDGTVDVGATDVGELEAWVYTWKDIDKTDINGNPYTFKVVETPIDNFTTTGGTEFAETTANVFTTTINNKYNPPKDEVIANKDWEYGPTTKPTVWFKLYRNIEGGTLEAADDAEVLELDGITEVKWENIKQTDDKGNKYTFSVKEVDADGNDFTPENYSKEEEGLTVTNTYNIPKIIVKASKTWEGGEDLTKTVTLQLQRSTDGTTYSNVGSTVTLDGTVDVGATDVGELEAWVYTWKDIDKTDINGNPYTFKVVETPIDNFTTTGGTEFAETTANVFTTTINNKYNPDVVSYTIEKVWDNNGVADTDIPDSVTVILTRKSTGDTFTDVQSITLYKDGNWEKLIDNLPKSDERGNLYEYAIREDQVPGYGEPSYDFANNTFTVTNPRNVVTKSVTKEWASVEGENTPAEITYVLLQDGIEIASATVSDPYSHTFKTDKNGNALPEYNIVTGKNYEYKIDELEVTGYTSVINQETGEVTNTQKTISKTVTKEWVNETNVADPTNVKVELHKNGTKYKEVELNDGNKWTHEFTNLPEFDENGKEYVYTFVETNVPNGYTVEVNNETGIITNTKDVTSKTVSKEWVNTTEEANPTSVTVILTRNDGNSSEQVLNANNQWTYTWGNLPTHDVNGNEFTYTISENEVVGYGTKINQTTGVITNTKEVISLEVTKTWVDESGGLDKPTKITINLYRNDSTDIYKTLELSQGTQPNVWTGEFTNLPEYNQAGDLIEYTIDEVEVPGYENVVDEYSITNTRVLVTIPVTKTWDKLETEEYPGSITYNLLRDLEVIGSKTVNSPDWDYEFITDSNGNKLPKTNPLTGEDYSYSVEEKTINGYDSNVEGFAISNTQILIDVEVNKDWVGGSMPNTTIELWKKGTNASGDEINEKVGEFIATSTETNKVFEQLPEYDPSGKKYVYYVLEPEVPANYTKTIEGLTVTNTFKKPTTPPTDPPKDPEVKWTCEDEGKVWNEEKQMCVFAYKAPNTSTNNNMFIWITSILTSIILLLWNNMKRRSI